MTREFDPPTDAERNAAAAVATIDPATDPDAFDAACSAFWRECER